MLKLDVHEPESIRKLLRKQGIEFEVKALPYGDFLYDKKICIERKEIKDFVGSIRSGRLKLQLWKMQNHFPYCYLIISGEFKTLFHSPYFRTWTVNHHLGAIASLSARFNVKLIQVPNDSQLVNLVGRLIAKHTDGKVPMLADTHIKAHIQQLSQDDVKLGMFCALKGISVSKARMLRKHLDVEIVRKDGKEINSEKDLTCFEGIGETTAKTIMEINQVKEQN